MCSSSSVVSVSYHIEIIGSVVLHIGIRYTLAQSAPRGWQAVPLLLRLKGVQEAENWEALVWADQKREEARMNMSKLRSHDMIAH